MNRIKKQSKEMQPLEDKGLTNNSQEDIFAEDNQYEIETSRKNTESLTGALKQQQQCYIERLETKIQTQAKRLTELEKYKYDSEKRIRQSNHNTDETISQVDKSTKTKQSNREKEHQSEKSKGKGKGKGQEVFQVKEKNDNLYSKYSNLLNNFNVLGNINNKTSEGSIVSDISVDKNNTTTNINVHSGENANANIKTLTKEKERITEALRQETLKVEEQKNIIAILKQTLDSEFIKSGVLTKHITPANLIDFIQLKSESENYRKQLVLSQALVDSLKSEIEEIAKDKDKAEKRNKELSNNEREMNSKVTQYQDEIKEMKKELDSINNKLLEDENSYECRGIIDSTQRESKNRNANIDLKVKLEDTMKRYHQLNAENSRLNNKVESLMKDKALYAKEYQSQSKLQEENEINRQRIDELTKTNLNLRKLIDEADIKLSENYKMNKDIKSRMLMLEAELKLANNSNQYINMLKASLNKLFASLIKSSQEYFTIINEENDTVLTDHFSNSITSLANQLNNLSNKCHHQHQNEADGEDINESDIELIEMSITLMKVITNEFLSMYSKLFESNHNCNESNIKANILKEKLKEEAKSFHQDNKTLIKQMESMSTKNDQAKAKVKKLKKAIASLNETILRKDNELKEIKTYSGIMNTKLALMTNDKDRIAMIIQLISQSISNKSLNRLIEEYLMVNKEIFKLTNDKLKVEEKILSMQSEYDKMKLEDKRQREPEGNDLIEIIIKEQNALKELLYELQNKIEDNQSRLNDIKTNIDQFNYSPSVSIHSNGNNNNKPMTMAISMSDPNMFNTIHHHVPRKQIENQSNLNCNYNYYNPQLTEFDDSDMIDNRSNGRPMVFSMNTANKTTTAPSSRAKRANKSNLTYEINKQ